MKINDKLQLLPLLRIAIFLTAGIMSGYALYPVAPLAACLAILAVTLSVSFFLDRRSITQSVMIQLCVFMLGFLLITRSLSDVDISPPAGRVTYTAVIADEPVVKEKTVSCDMVVTNASEPFKIKAVFLKDTRSERLRIGEGIEACSRLEPPRNYESSTFDYASYLRCHGFVATTFIYKTNWRRTVVDLTGLSLIERTRLAAMCLRHELLERYGDNGFQGQELVVISAMTLGDKSLLSKETKEAYSKSGASHILALSGMHLGIIYFILSMFIPRHSKRHFLPSFLLIASIWCFVFIVGMSPSVVRAATMLTVYTFSDMLNRNSMSLNTLSFAAIALLIANPLCLYDVGFQLSFTAMLSIILFFNPIYKLFPRKIHSNYISGKLIGCLTVSLAAQLGVFPLISYHFGIIPCYFFLTNFIVSFAALVLIGGAVLMFVSTPLAFLQSFIAGIMSLVAKYLNLSVSRIAAMPGSHISDFHLSALQVVMVYVAIFSCYALAGYIKKMCRI